MITLILQENNATIKFTFEQIGEMTVLDVKQLNENKDVSYLYKLLATYLYQILTVAEEGEMELKPKFTA